MKKMKGKWDSDNIEEERFFRGQAGKLKVGTRTFRK